MRPQLIIKLLVRSSLTVATEICEAGQIAAAKAFIALGVALYGFSLGVTGARLLLSEPLVAIDPVELAETQSLALNRVSAFFRTQSVL